MITEELKKYVKEQRDAGYHDEAIRQVLLEYEWSEEDVNGVLKREPEVEPEKVKEESSPSSGESEDVSSDEEKEEPGANKDEGGEQGQKTEQNQKTKEPTQNKSFAERILEETDGEAPQEDKKSQESKEGEFSKEGSVDNATSGEDGIKKEEDLPEAPKVNKGEDESGQGEDKSGPGKMANLSSSLEGVNDSGGKQTNSSGNARNSLGASKISPQGTAGDGDEGNPYKMQIILGVIGAVLLIAVLIVGIFMAYQYFQAGGA